MIYNFDLGIGWASSGVEYAQLYRCRIFRELGEPARFVFTDMFPQENIQHYTSNLGFRDEEVIWLYAFFTDQKIAPVTYTLEDFEKTLADQDFRFNRTGRTGRLVFNGGGDFCTLYFVDENCNRLHRVEYVSGGFLIRKDYFTRGRLYTEYYAPLDGKAHLYMRRFFNTDGTTAYEEYLDGQEPVYRFPDEILFSKEELVGYMTRRLNMTGDDVAIIDRTTGIGQAILENCGDARTGIVVHADHYSAGNTTDDYILWNNYYEYSFRMYRHISFFITSTDAQRDLMREQFLKYVGEAPAICTIPVGSLEKLTYPETGAGTCEGRRPFSIVTASRLASEKHLDWVIRACVIAREKFPELTLDIYGAGGEYNSLRDLIKENQAGGYIRLMGQHDMSDVYRNYELYLSGSTSEGFGLSLMEAVGSGLPIIGFDVPYGDPTFISDGENGYLIPVTDEMSVNDHVEALARAVEKFFAHSGDCRRAFREKSYQVASEYLTEKVMMRWERLLAGEI